MKTAETSSRQSRGHTWNSASWTNETSRTKSPLVRALYNFFLKNSPEIACQAPKPPNSFTNSNIHLKLS
jgi:hypothetical protein